MGVPAVNAQGLGTTGAPQQIQGTVRYAVGGKPVERALVRCSGTGGNNEKVTDANGRFFFMVSAGHYECGVRMPGYIPESRSLDIISGGEFLDFRLRDDGSAKSPAAPNPELTDVDVPAKARENFQKGVALIDLGKKESMQEGVLLLEKAVAEYPKYVQANLRLGTTYLDLEQYDKAEAALKKTIEIDPKAANAYFALGEVYLRQKKNEDAEKILLQGLQIEDRSAKAHLTLARTYVAMAQKIKDETENRPFRVKAFDQVNEALKYDNELAHAHWIKANLLISVGRDADAQKELEEYLRLDAKGPFASQAKTYIDRIKKELAGQKP
jgi:tetratricopeptide (TPR) repeat protein